MRVRSEPVSGTLITVTHPKKDKGELEKILSELFAANHRGLYFIEDPIKTLILITSQDNTNNIFDLNYFDRLLSNILPGANVTGKDAGLYSLGTFIPYIVLLRNNLTSIKTDSLILIKILNSVLRANECIRNLHSIKFQEWDKGNNPSFKKTRSHEIYSSPWDSFFSSPMSYSSQVRGMPTYGGAGMGFVEDMARRNREQIERQNEQLTYEFRSSTMKARINRDYICKVEATLVAAKRFVIDLIIGHFTEEETFLRWQSYMSDDEVTAPNITSFISQKSHTDVEVTIKNNEEYLQRYDSDNIGQYYAEVNAFFDEVILIFNDRLDTKRFYEPTMRSEAKLQLMDLVVDPESRDVFVFDMQRALMATGLLEKFVINILFYRDARIVFENEIDALVKKYSLLDDSYASLEKCLRSTVVNDQMTDFTFLLSNIPLNVNAQDSNPERLYTALHHAVTLRRKEYIKRLLERNAKCDIAAADGSTPLSLATADDQDTEIKAMFSMQQAVVATAPDTEIKLAEIEDETRRLKM